MVLKVNNAKYLSYFDEKNWNDCGPYQKYEFLSIDYTNYSMKNLEEMFKKWFPNKISNQHIISNEICSNEQVAIIVPYRNRYRQLITFLRHMHPFLMKQNTNYRIFVINQNDNIPFNRATLLNIGFIQSQKFNNYTCFIFTDVDLLPENDYNRYDCSESPNHLSKCIDVFNYSLPYNDIMGGAIAISKHHFLHVNGFSNMFWGWGGEDDDFSYRIKSSQLNVNRKSNKIARYKMNKHEHTRTNSKINPNRFKLLKYSKFYKRKTGLNDLKYIVKSIEIHFLFTEINVTLEPAYETYKLFQNVTAKH